MGTSFASLGFLFIINGACQELQKKMQGKDMGIGESKVEEVK